MAAKAVTGQGRLTAGQVAQYERDGYVLFKQPVFGAQDSAQLATINANTSDKRRAGYTMRYFPTSSRVLPDHPANRDHKLWLARGQDLAGNRCENA